MKRTVQVTMEDILKDAREEVTTAENLAQRCISKDGEVPAGAVPIIALKRAALEVVESVARRASPQTVFAVEVEIHP